MDDPQIQYDLTKVEVLSEIFTKDLVIKEQEVLLRKDELELQRQAERHAFEYSMETLKIKKEDRLAYMTHITKNKRNFYSFMLVVIAILVFLIYCAITHNKDALAKDLIRALIYMTIALSGYYVGKTGKHEKKEMKKDDSS